jgi:protein-L-isoaspartate(D-aspartate) O-methyltransferase
VRRSSIPRIAVARTPTARWRSRMVKRSRSRTWSRVLPSSPTELVPELACDAQRRLHELGFDNVSVHVGDGSLGLPEYAPYDAILVAAAARSIPTPLVDQLRVGGRLVIPVGPGKLQVLTVVTKTETGTQTEEYDTCVYVPLLGAAGGN